MFCQLDAQPVLSEDQAPCPVNLHCLSGGPEIIPAPLMYHLFTLFHNLIYSVEI